MPLHDDESQVVPSVPTELDELRAKATRMITVLEENKVAVHAWFFKALLALNLVIGSFVLWAVVLHLARAS